MSALMLAVIVVPLVSLGPNQAYAVDTGAVDVTYHSSKDDPGTKITYYGIASAEYNPVYWNSDDRKVNWVAPSKDVVIEGTLRIEFAESGGNKFNVPEGMNFFYDNEELHWNCNYYWPYGDYNDPMSFLGVFLSYSVQNNGGYNNKDFDKELSTAMSTVDAKERMDAMHRAEDILMEDMGLIPLYFYTDPIMISKKLSDVIYDPLGAHKFFYAKLAK